MHTMSLNASKSTQRTAYHDKNVIFKHAQLFFSVLEKRWLPAMLKRESCSTASLIWASSGNVAHLQSAGRNRTKAY
jgi:hypothetical protein